MNGRVPHIVQYQGSKRILASQILRYMPLSFDRLIEPFSGMAAVSVAVAKENRTDRFIVNDLNAPLIGMLSETVENPESLIGKYAELWEEQFGFTDDHVQHFYHVRERFNGREKTPENMLYLLARCVKGAVRYGRDGNFNQSPDKRRHGTNPKNIAENIKAVSALLKGKCVFSSFDYREVFDMATRGDLVYMDPPYQGVTNARDSRYLSGLPLDEFAASIEVLNQKGVDFLISYDGKCGGREYGDDLPAELGCRKILLNAGISSQATLLGKREVTYEALYISRNLQRYADRIPHQLTMMEIVG